MSEKHTFEENIAELEKIISDLESGNAPLGDCIDMFENGVRLSGVCLRMIDEARRKITLLTEEGESDYNPTDGDGNE